MALAPGVRLGAYEIVALIGSGGMGEVYRARDARLGRDVAVKIVPALSADAERLRRFEHEARAAAGLNHPNILAVHDVGTASGSDGAPAVPYVVAELLEGETLRERLHGGPLPLRKAVDAAIQIARGLAAAHDKGVVHRDLKPENVFVTDDGRIKILDFGLAKLTEPDPAISGVSAVVTAPPDTLPGMVLGTVGYMAPEQVRGRGADHRADIFAFGTILYEMLSGRRAFTGDTAADTMTAILKDDPPDLPSHERNIPPALARIVDRCLEKQPTARFQSAGDLAFALEALTSGTSSTAARVPALDVDPRPTRAIRRVVSAAIAVFAIAIVATAVWIAAARARSERPGPVVSFTFEPSDGWTFAASGWAGTGISNAPLAVAPDGSRIAFVARNAAGSPALWVRRLDTVAAQMLPGTDGAASPFWSPDSRFVGFFADGKLKKVDLTGAPPATIADVPNGVDGSWGRDNVIVFAVISGEVTPLQRVSASGGIPTAGTTVLPGETKHVRPLFLPDGRHLLFRMGTANRGPIFLTALDSTERRRLVDAESTNVAFSSDHLLFLRDRTLMAQRFPESTWMLDGEPFPVAESIATTPSSSTVFAHFAASPSGVLVYQVGPPAVLPRLQWVDRSGKASAVAGEPGAYGDLELSPDGGRALVSVSDSGHGTRDVWIFDLKRGVRSRFTFDPSEDQTSVWSPDGETVVFNSRRSDRADLYIKPANGSTAEQLLLSDATDKVPTSWSPDGRFLMFMKVSATTSDLWVLPMTGERKPMPFLDSKFNESAGRFSPDGQWVAYTSNESGRPEVYVTSFPRPGGRWQISTGSGVQPRWRSDGTELIYRDLATNRLIAAAVRPERSGFTVAQVTPLFVTRPGGPRSFFDLSPDGQTILVNAPGPDAANPQPSPLTVVVNWAAALKR